MRWPPASLVPLYLVVQAIAIAAWWCVLWFVPATRVPFVPPGCPESALFAWMLPDLVVLVGGSLLAAAAVTRQRPGARALLWLLLGAVGYATLWCLGTNLATGAGFWSTAMMAPACACMVWAVAVHEASR